VVEIAARLLCAPASPPVASVTRFSPGHAAEDSRLVREARGGDASAFERLYERYARVIHGVVLARVGRVDVDDLVQDVFLAAWARLATLRDPQAFGGWLTSIARRRAIDHHRRAVETTELPADLEAPDAAAPRAEAIAVIEVVRSLPDAYRETLVLRLVEGMTGQEIADRTGMTPASVRVNLHRGMRLLRDRLQR